MDTDDGAGVKKGKQSGAVGTSPTLGTHKIGEKGAVASPFAVPAAIAKQHQNKPQPVDTSKSAAPAATASGDKTGAMAVAALIDELRNTDLSMCDRHLQHSTPHWAAHRL